MDGPGEAIKESQDPGCHVLYSQKIKEKKVSIKLTYQWLKRAGLKEVETAHQDLKQPLQNFAF